MGKYSRRECVIAVIALVLMVAAGYLLGSRGTEKAQTAKPVPAEELLKAEDLQDLSQVPGEDIICYLENPGVTPDTDVLHVVMENLGDKHLPYQVPFPLERLEEGKWRRVKLIDMEESHRVDLPYSMDPGIVSREEIFLGIEYPHLTPGLYRLVIEESRPVLLHFRVSEAEAAE